MYKEKNIGRSLPNPLLTASQTNAIVITNNTTNDPEGACTDSTTLTFVVDDSPEAATVIMAPSCDDNPNDTDGISIFDTTSLAVAYTHLRAHESPEQLISRLML